MNVPAMQAALAEASVDGWLLYDFRHMNPVACRVAGFAPDRHMTRRWFGIIPREGEPEWLHSAIEAHHFAALPGRKTAFVGWRDLESNLARMLKGRTRVAMEYSPRCAVPVVAFVDAGTVELVRDFGVEVVSSADLVQTFEARWGAAGLASHERVSKHLGEIASLVQGWVREAVRGPAKGIAEIEIQRRMVAEYTARGLVTNGPPIVARNHQAGNPHFELLPGNSETVVEGDLLLTDLWAKEKGEDAVYGDITWMAFVGKAAPAEMQGVWDVVMGARDAGIALVSKRCAAGQVVRGAEVDDATRAVVAKAGLERYFIHRTGHSIGLETHGNGANLDNLETRDERTLIADTGFSIEPGVYQPAFGVRSEIDMYIDTAGKARVSSAIQHALPALLA